MTDGTTGFQVAPITEDDMSRVQAILKRAADAIVGMSQLAADVDMLRTTVNGLQADCERLRNQNNALDEALAHSRSVRDAQSHELAEVKSQLVALTQERDDLKSTCTYDGNHINELNSMLDQARTERDDHGFRVMELEEKLASAEAKLAKVRESLGIVEAATPVVREAAPVLEMGQIEPEPQAPLRTYHGQHWEAGYLWDYDKGEYYTEA